jgi:Tfp pilus assembly protein PilF
MTRTRGRTPLVAGLLLVAVAAVYGQVAGFELLTYDDPVYVAQNRMVQGGLSPEGVRFAFGFHESNWHPLTWLSLMLDADLGGTSAIFHVTNAILHWIAALLLYLSLARMTGATWRPAVVALLFAVHPLHVESVAWVSERKDVLSAVFWFLTMLAYAAYAERPGPRRYALVVVSFALGLMAKPMLVTLPIVLLFLDLWPLEREGWKRLVLEKIPLLALSAASSVVTILAQRAGGAMASSQVYPLADRVENAIVSVAAYLGQTVWPVGLSFFYPHPRGGASASVVLLSLAVIGAGTFLAIRLARSRPYVPVGWCWYLVTLLPVLGIVQVGVQARADRYTYIPLVGIFVIAAWGTCELFERFARPAVAAAISAAVVVGLAASAYVQAGYWRDSETLYGRALALRPDNAVAHVNLATALLERNDAAGAETHAREALRLDPGHPEPSRILGNALARQGKLDEAIAVYRSAVAARPDDAILRSNLGAFLGDRGMLDEAEREIREAIRLAPDDSGARLNLGVVFARRERYDEAAREFAEALRLDPRNEAARRSFEQAIALSAKPR